MKLSRRQIFAIAAIAAATALTPAATEANTGNGYSFSKLSVENGLSQSTVFAVAQDTHGNVWLGTGDGLNRYDGRGFQTFHHRPGDGASLASSTVGAIFIDREGTMWVGTDVGLARFDYASGEFANFRLPGIDMHIFDIAETDDCASLVLATDIGVALFDKSEERLELKTYMTDAQVQTLCTTGSDIVIGTSNGMYRYSSAYGTVTRIMPELEHCDISCVTPASDGGLWVGTFGNGLCRVDAAMKVTGRIRAGDGLNSDYVRVVKEDSANHTLWIGTFDGLAIYDLQTGTFADANEISGVTEITRNSVRSIFMDNQNGVWIGTYYGGVNYFHPLACKFAVIRHDDSRNSLSSNTASCIVESPGGDCFWIGTNDAGVNRYDRRTGRFEHYDERHGLASNNVKCILPDGDCLWIGTHAGGLHRFDLRTHRAHSYPVTSGIPINNSCYSMLDNGDGTITVGSLSGLCRFDKRTGRVSAHPAASIEHRLGVEQILAMHRDSQRRIWFGTNTGVYLYTPEANEVRYISVRKDDVQVAVNCITEDSGKTIWVGTKGGGMARYDEQSGRFQSYTTVDGLPNDVVYGIVEDDLHRLWISTNRGVACFDHRQHSIRSYTRADGLSGDQFNPYSYCKSRTGTVLFGGIDGITMFNPHNIADNPFTPRTEIRGFSIFDKAVVRDDGRIRIIRDERNEIAEVRIPSSCNQFSIEFVAVNPLAAGRNTYTYRLDGFDQEWYTTEHGAATYSNLEPGLYTFLVRACNNDGRWCAETTQLKIRIQPMWWQTTLAKLLYALLVTALIGVIIYFVLSRMRMKMELDIERLENRRNAELSQQKIRLYINLAHELLTPLTLILSPLEDIREHGTTDKYVASRLKYVRRSSMKLLHIVNQLLSYRKAELGMFRTRIAMQELDTIVGDVVAMFEETAQNRDMDYILNSEIQGERLPVDRMFTEMIVTNLLSNAFKFTPDGGMIRVSLTHSGGRVRIAVRDSGPGIPRSERERIFDRFYQTDESISGNGIGLAIVKRLTEMLKGEVTVQSDGESYSEFVVSLPDDIAAYGPEELAPQNEVQSSKIGDVTLFLEEPETEAETGSDGEETPRESILVVSDDAEITKYVAEYFRPRYVLLTAPDGPSAVETLRTSEPGIVITYLKETKFDGIKFCHTVKQNIRTCHIPVVILGTDDTPDFKLRSLEAGADDYLAHPFSLSLLSAKIVNLLKLKYRLQHYYSNSMEVEPDKITSNSMDGEFLKKAIRIVEENIDNDEFSSNDFSRALCMSRSNLHLKMVSITGESATKFIRKIRFNYACRLLLERKYSIAEISSMVGFNSPSYFATSFKKHVGCLPTEYVNRNKKSDEQ